ncbi:KR domain-containing protein [Streptomyces sp. PA03-6a]|nr:KR domain-containing protein [Streptomyces sp. PA03-6a]
MPQAVQVNNGTGTGTPAYVAALDPRLDASWGPTVTRIRGESEHHESVVCDLTGRDQTAERITAVPQSAPLTAVVHTAGVLDGAVITALGPERLNTVLGSKVDALVHPNELTRGTTLAGHVTFTSVAGVTGSPGQANYAVADAITQHRHHADLPATPPAWGPFILGSPTPPQPRAVPRRKAVQ